MSIGELLRSAVADGRLFHILPRLPSSPTNRLLFGSPEVNRLVTGPWTSPDEEYRCGKLWEDFDRYIEGRRISVALDNPYKHPKSTYLSRLDPPRDEVWEIRSRDPKPGIRVFGRFVDRDRLVVFNWGFRYCLGGPDSNEFRREIRKCITEWRKVFLTFPPHVGSRVDEYVSDPTLSV